jgi:hypothetical protein
VHGRQAIRKAVVAALRNQTAAEERVKATRVWPWRSKDLPAIAVYTLSESVNPESAQTAPRELERTVELAIEAAVKLGEDVDDVLDGLALEIERAMHADWTLGDTAADSVLQSTDVTVVPDGDQDVGLLRIVYRVWYYTHAPEAEDVTLDSFTNANIRYDLGGEQHAENEAQDALTLEGV